jgi:hypothetical protein
MKQRLDPVMSKIRSRWFGIFATLAVCIHFGYSQTGTASGLYQIISGSYSECCRIGGTLRSSLPNERQSFVRLTIDPQRDLATMVFLGADSQTIFSIAPCPPANPINFSFDCGFLFSDTIIFHVDPGPPPYAVYWNYAVSNLTDHFRIDGILGTAQQSCADFPTQFTHSNVVAVLVQGPRLRIMELSKDGALLFVQGNTGWTNVIEASTDLINWMPASTNLMPNTDCPICPYILFRDPASTNLVSRFYRSFEIPPLP